MDGERPDRVTEHQMMQQRRNRPIALWAVSAVAGLAAAGFVMVFGVFFLPVTVDAIAYLAGAGGQGTFTATGSSQSCTWNGASPRASGPPTAT
jgi:hypothetical protein